MPDNNRKALSTMILSKLEAVYSFEYDADTDEVITKLSTCKKQTRHPASKTFVINAKKFKKKLQFTPDVIELWKSFQSNNELKKHSLIEVNNVVNKLKIMYQEPTRQTVINMLRRDFDGISHL